jgi:hypothetical protein
MVGRYIVIKDRYVMITAVILVTSCTGDAQLSSSKPPVPETSSATLSTADDFTLGPLQSELSSRLASATTGRHAGYCQNAR